jgi:protein-disulfide isomerase
VKAAAAALAAGSQGKFWEFHDLLFENYNRINDQKIQDIALSLNLDQVEFEKKMNDPEIQQKIGQDVMDGRQAGVNSTPSVFINGRLLRNRTLSGFEEVIDKELEKLKK